MLLIYARLVLFPLGSVSFGEFALALLLAIALSMWIYWHASRHGSKQENGFKKIVPA